MRFLLISIITIDILLSTFLQSEAQSSEMQKDVKVLLSITIFSKKDRSEDLFPNVYPSIENLRLIIYDSLTKNDSINCSYTFPFLKLPVSRFHKIQDASTKSLSFFYNRVNSKTNNRFLIEVPIKWLSLEDPLFIVLEHIRGENFSVLQRFRGSTTIGGLVKARTIY